MDDRTSLIWEIITGLLVILGGVLGYTWRKQDKKVVELETRLTYLETHYLTREEFNGAMATSRRELKEDIKNILDEMRVASTAIHISVADLGKRMDSILMSHIREQMASRHDE